MATGIERHAIRRKQGVEHLTVETGYTKTAEGRYIGNPVCPGYVVAIEGHRRDGSYILGKWQPYPPHQGVVIAALKELVKQGSVHKAAQTLCARGVVFPFFPEELRYMETRSVSGSTSETTGATPSPRIPSEAWPLT